MNKIEMHPVESSHVEAVGLSASGDVIVQYKGSPKKYSFPAGLDAEAFAKLKGSESVGKAIRSLGVKSSPWEPHKEK